MRIGVPKEIKAQEFRVGMTPAGIRELVTQGHDLVVETRCGAGVGFDDEDYRRAGATVVGCARELYESAQLIVKVKEPQAAEIQLLNGSHTVFGYFHLAATPELAKDLLDSSATCIAYETVTDDEGALPLLTPMSEVAGRVAVQVGARFLEEPQGGMGILLGGVPGVSAANVVILGGGVAGTQAAHVALGMGARVDIVDNSLPRLRELDMDFNGCIGTHFSTQLVIEELVTQADLVIGSVLLPGGSAPKLVTTQMIKQMKKGSVIVDIAIDQGGCFETSKPTTHQDPIYKVDGVSHYCVTNMPSAVARTATMALTNATLPYVLTLAEHGVTQALEKNCHLRDGLNISDGKIRHPAVAKALGYSWTKLPSA